MTTRACTGACVSRAGLTTDETLWPVPGRGRLLVCAERVATPGGRCCGLVLWMNTDGVQRLVRVCYRRGWTAADALPTFLVYTRRTV